MECRILFTMLLVSEMVLSAYGQDSIKVTNKEVANKKESRVKLIPLPVVAANPTSGWMFGFAPGAYWLMGDPSNTTLSSALGTLIYTTKKQLIVTAKANTFFEGDKWNMMTDIRFFLTSQPTYGLGTGPQSSKPAGTGFADYTDNPYKPIDSEQMMEFNFFRIYNTLLKRINDTRFFAGVGYHFDYHYQINDQLLYFDSIPNTITSHYAYSTRYGFDPEKYTSSGISLNILYDSRDNAVNPYKGRYASSTLK
ncbi:hypothetical protein [Chryseolinea sp. H1M3-3]|uniref:hypothetical protein n=1 Tax=Chryseolinea sp. H1M3-3 TaxID=3034144 RepID=UPI0023ED1AD3|nr:hypothetical protein [Chryseolinea sp. H1M3-3]